MKLKTIINILIHFILISSGIVLFWLVTVETEKDIEKKIRGEKTTFRRLRFYTHYTAFHTIFLLVLDYLVTTTKYFTSENLYYFFTYFYKTIELPIFVMNIFVVSFFWPVYFIKRKGIVGSYFLEKGLFYVIYIQHSFPIVINLILIYKNFSKRNKKVNLIGYILSLITNSVYIAIFLYSCKMNGKSPYLLLDEGFASKFMPYLMIGIPLVELPILVGCNYFYSFLILKYKNQIN